MTFKEVEINQDASIDGAVDTKIASMNCQLLSKCITVNSIEFSALFMRLYIYINIYHKFQVSTIVGLRNRM